MISPVHLGFQEASQKPFGLCINWFYRTMAKWTNLTQIFCSVISSISQLSSKALVFSSEKWKNIIPLLGWLQESAG